MTAEPESLWAKLAPDAAGLVTAVVQHAQTAQILMVGHMNREALGATLTRRRVTFWSRSRSTLWEKGESSGNTQQVKDVAYDCDADTLLIQVEQIGAACHEGYKSCFFTSVKEGESKITEERLIDPKEMYGKKS